MKKILMIVAAMVCVWVHCGAQELKEMTMRGDVKTVELYKEGNEMAAPVLVLGEGAGLVLEFDVLGAEAEELRWRIRHCDRWWRADKMEEQEVVRGFGEGVVEEYDFSFTTLRDYVHYRTRVPGKYDELTFSGNYVVEVTDGDGTLLLRRRFWVSEEGVKIECDVGRPYDGVAVDRRQEVDVTLSSKRENLQLQEEWMDVMVRQNGRWDNGRWLEMSGYEGDGLAYRYRQCNVFYGGNRFRWFDCSNLRTAMYNVARIEEYGGEVFAILRPEEDRSKKHYLSEKSLNGGMKVNVWDRNNSRLEADYVWVNFNLPMAQPLLEGGVYIVGALTEWRMDSTSRMEYNPQYRAYTKRLLLKQGYYSYQLLVRGGEPEAGSRELRSATAALEGDHRETQNGYTVYCYYRSPADRGDRLLGVVNWEPGAGRL